MGRHKEITCPECGYVYTVNAYREVDSDQPDWHGPARPLGHVRELPVRGGRRDARASRAIASMS